MKITEIEEEKMKKALPLVCAYSLARIHTTQSAASIFFYYFLVQSQLKIYICRYELTNTRLTMVITHQNKNKNDE